MAQSHPNPETPSGSYVRSVARGILYFLGGAFVLCCFATFQKIQIGAPLVWEGYAVPLLFGGMTGWIIGILNAKRSRRLWDLQHEIEKRTQAEDALRTSEERYRVVAEDTPVLICRFLPGGEITYANRAYCEYFDKTPEELVGSSFLSLIPEADRDAVMANISAMTAESPAQSHEHQVIAPDGEIHWQRWTNAVMFDAKGQPTVYQSIGEDITERKQAEDTLHMSRVMLERVMNNIPQAVFWKDRQSVFLGCNMALAKTVGLDAPEDIVGKTDYDLSVTKEEADFYRECDRRVMDSDTPELGIEEHLHGADGSKRWLTTNKVPIHDADDKVMGVLVTFEDITERKQAEEALLESEERLRGMFENMSSGVAVYRAVDDGEDFVFVDFNRAGERIEKIAREDVIGKRVTEAFPGVEEFGVLEVLRRVWQTGQSEYFPVAFYKDARIEGWRENYVYRLSSGEVVAIYDDVTARKQAEEALAEKERYYRSLIHSLHEDIMVIDRECRIVDVNNSYLTTTKHSRDEVIGRHCFEVTHGSDVPCYELEGHECRLREVFDSGKACNCHHVHTASDGSPVHVNVLLSPMKDAQGRVTHVVEAARDITDMFEAQEERERLLHDTGERVKELRCAFGVLESIRKRETLEQVFEDTVALIPSGWHRPEIARGRIRFDDQEYVAQPFAETEWRMGADIIVDGELRGTVEMFYIEVPCLDCDHGRDDGVFVPEERDLLDGIARALSEAIERKEAEAARERLTHAIEQAVETVVITDVEGTIQYVNPAFERITGYTREEAIGRNPRILQSGEHDEAFYREMWETLTRGETWSGRIVNKKKDDTLFTEEVTISPVRDASDKTVNYVAVKRDITQEMTLEAQLQESQKMEAVGQLAGGIAHDFNNLLQAITGYTEMAKDDLAAEHPARASLKQVAQAGERATVLVRQILAFSRRQVLDMQYLDLNDVIADLMKMIRRVIGEHVKLDILVGRNLGVVRADPGQIGQILINLCVNARDAMPEGGVITVETENVRIDEEYGRTHVWAQPGRYVLLSVTDTGCGMDKATLERVFEPFFTTKDVGKGTGLGLSMVYGLVKQHGGFIHLYSEVGQGTTVKIYLPLVERAAAAVGNKIEGPIVGGTETILLAEDDPGVLGISKALLEQAGYTVLTATDGREALRVFDAHGDRISLALLDVMMPELGGKAVYERIRKRKTDIRFLFSSGYSMNALHTNFILNEGMALIQKPYQRDSLLRAVRVALDA